MIVRGNNFTITKILSLLAYYTIARYLPISDFPLIGGGRIRYFLCKRIFRKCGEKVNIERGAYFGSGAGIIIGDNSGIGINATIPSNTIIGSNVMMGPNCYIFDRNHSFDDTEIPMIQQGFTPRKQVVIEDDVWIGRNVTIMSGRTIKKGSIIAACCCLTKDYPEYSIVGGVPSKLIKSRKRIVL